MAAGEPLQLTNGLADTQPDLSADGRFLFFSGLLSVNPRNWIEDLVTRTKSTWTTMAFEDYPIAAADGSRVAYQARDPATSKMGVYVTELVLRQGERPQPGVPRKITGHDDQDCGWPWSWSSTGTRLLYNCPIPGPVWMYDVASGDSREVTGKLGLFNFKPSPDYRWVEFSKVATDGSTFREFIARSPFDAGVLPPEHDWIAVTPDEENAQKAAWSADGAVLYFFSTRDGFGCVWAQRLDRYSKSPLGPAFAVYHSHAARRSISNVPGLGQNLSVAGNRIAFVLGEQTGNLWMATWNQ